MNAYGMAAAVIAAAIVGVMAQRAAITPEAVDERKVPDERKISDERRATGPMEAKVLSVEAAPRDGVARPREAIVKLSTGEKVRASVPPGCVVFAGQVTRLARQGEGASRRYVVVENGRNS